mgnify:CR=1 FL=1
MFVLGRLPVPSQREAGCLARLEQARHSLALPSDSHQCVTHPGNTLGMACVRICPNLHLAEVIDRSGQFVTVGAI